MWAPIGSLLRGWVGEFISQRIEAIVVDLEFQFLVETVEHFRVNAVVDWCGHRWLRLRTCWVACGVNANIGQRKRGHVTSWKAESRSLAPASRYPSRLLPAWQRSHRTVSILRTDSRTARRGLPTGRSRPAASAPTPSGDCGWSPSAGRNRWLPSY